MEKLNLGCQTNYLEGYINLDIDPEVDPDILHDLNFFPYPFKDNHFDEVYMSHILEHLEDVHRVMKEVCRITKKGGIIYIRVPHYSNPGSYADPTHIHHFSHKTLLYIINDNKILRHEIVVSGNKLLNYLSGLVNLFPYIYERFLISILSLNEMIWVIEVKKGNRGGKRP